MSFPVIIMIGISAIDVICAGFMIVKFMRLYHRNRASLDKKNNFICDKMMLLSFCFGSILGILLWSYIIALILFSATENFRVFLIVAYIGSVITILPCIKGMSIAVRMKI